ncbi:exodeoxyribonuclease V subunit gamma [Endozoicomonas sp. OPT23]|uniref:exodeoxyribonuclease V subunit gamma n=1 Tax=Endozoicomonas sp. OPT23 TaxID=2072845 RepID=UPI001DFD175A|nr:exodeoxyribonuclease V subunit gamma [Endozoicomonas sp. OPT23]
MLTIYHSNQLDLLKDLLLDRIQKQPLDNPLSEEQILVQSPGMAQWLRQEIASGLGIAASLSFPLPASFLWQTFVDVLPDVPRRSAFNKEAMTWKLVTLLPDMIAEEHFEPLRHYLDKDNDGVRCYQLAGKVADIFDQYLVYRPEWIADWEKGLNSHADGQLWQPILWRALVQKTSELDQSHWHRANMHHSFIHALNTDKQNKLPKRLFVFGISAMPPHFVDTLKALAQQTDVHLMVCNPCQYYWGDEKDPKYLARLSARLFAKNLSGQPPSSQQRDLLLDEQSQGNSLLASMGKLGRDYIHQLFELEANEIVAFVEGKDNSLLNKVQKDILELEGNQKSSDFTISPNDRSLVFHSSHTPLREVEVLHDQLLQLFEKNPQLTPRDVVVMLPDVDQYSPWIQAVFGGLDNQYEDSRYIPYSISDRSASNEHPVLPGILQLLNLDQNRCGASELLELLEIPAIQRRFGFDESGFETVRQWVTDAGIRWGVTPEHQQMFDLPARAGNSWLFGIRRMLLAYAMPESSGLFAGILPFEPSQGMDAVLAGQLALFIDHTEQLINTLDQPRTIEQWRQFCHQLIEDFIEAEEDDEYPLLLVRESFEHLTSQLEDAGYQENLSRPVLLDYLTERLTSERSSQRFLSGKVNFCTLMPMRSIPFKVVCLLGMNDGAYPRSMPPVGFDLMAQSPRRGDRSRRDDDRYLFLEALLSAQDTFYVSYVGNSIKDNSERIPSVLVSELLEYCNDYTGEKSAEDRLLHQHSLQPFSPANFKLNNEERSYAREWLPVAEGDSEALKAFTKNKLTEAEKPQQLEVTELLRFYRNPCQYFCNRRLKVFFEDYASQPEDTEPFEVDPLDSYQIRQSLTGLLLTEADVDEYSQRLNATGQLPHGAFGELLLDEQQQSVQPLASDVKSHLIASRDDIEVNLNIESIQLTGWLRQIYQSGPVRYRPARLKARDILYGWIEHLCYCAVTKKPGSTRLFALDKNAHFDPVDKDIALDHLTTLVKHYLDGMNEPLAFFPETGMVWQQHFGRESGNEGGNESDNTAAAELAARNTFYGGYMKMGESENAYITRIYPSLEDVFPDFKKLSLEIFDPALQHFNLENRDD